MEEQAASLSEYLIRRLENSSPGARLLIGISGIPASGKSTFAALVVQRCNEILSGGPFGAAILVGLDGWHLTRAQLDDLPDPRLAHDRRGAHWTFDGKSYAAFVAALRASASEISSSGETASGTRAISQKLIQGGAIGLPSHPSSIFAPSFDHALKDPTPDSVEITPQHRIVVIEGLYAFLSIDPWRRAGEMLDERWFIDVDVEEATRRIVTRHVVTGVAKDLEEALWRAETNDMPNGKFVLENSLDCTRRIPSVPRKSTSLQILS